jgi:UDP-glucose 4-epimerase
MRVVVTGGGGFIGANLCRDLLRAEQVEEVIVLDNFATSSRSNLDGVDVTLVEGSILDEEALDTAMGGADAVVHLAALGSVPRSVLDPMASHTTNTTGTILVLEAARRNGRLQTIVASSSSVYGANPVLPKTEDLASRPLSPYAATKVAAEAYTLAYGYSFQLPVLAFRLFNVFGPLQTAGHTYAAVIPSFVDAALAGRPLRVDGDGTQSRDFTYVGTVTAIITDAIVRRLTSPEPTNLAFGSRITLLDVIEELEQAIGHPIERRYEPARPGDVPHSQADNTRLKALFGEIRPVPFRDGLRATVEWMRSTATAAST